ncbi:MAG: patatin-like phospholipase family protein [Patescibacteria group bacterium]
MLGIIALGGGFNGAISVGYWKYLQEKKIRPDYVQLISVNVLNGLSFIARQNIGQLEYWWTNIVAKRGPSFIFQKGNRFDFVRKLLWGDCLFNSKGLEFLIEKGGDIPGFFLSPIYTEIVTRNESRNYDLHFFSNKDAKPLLMSDIILGATALIPAFRPRLINNEYHSDALTFDIERAIKYGCDTIILMRNDHGKKIIAPRNHWSLRLTGGMGNLIDELTDLKLQIARLTYPNHKIIELKIKKPIPHLSTDNFRKGSDDIQKAIDYGYEAAARILK